MEKDTFYYFYDGKEISLQELVDIEQASHEKAKRENQLLWKAHSFEDLFGNVDIFSYGKN